MTTPAKTDLVIFQGATFSKLLKLSVAGTPMDITGYTFRMQVRESKATSSPILLELTSANGKITTVPLMGEVSLEVSATDTALLSFLQAFYDLEMVNGTVVTRILEGSCILSKEVTK